MKVITGTSSEPDTTLSVRIRVVFSDLTQTEVSLHVWDQGNEASSCLLLDEVHRTEFSEQYKSSTDTSNSFTTKQAKSWIDTCQERHPLCRKATSSIIPSFRPSRMLELKHGEAPTLRLLSLDQKSTGTGEPFEQPEYVALSHCWGNTEIIKLSTANMQCFHERIRFSMLPLNFQHSVRTILDLGYKHLWIDSLCIIQDSTEDWEHEAPKMGLLYANAACTISATVASNPGEGLYTPIEFVGDCFLRQDNEFALVVRSWAREESALENLFETKVDHAPITQRGWVFQESILSQRVLHFARGIVLFECNTMRASQYHDIGISHRRRLNIRDDGRLHLSRDLERLRVLDEQFERVGRMEKIAINGRKGRFMLRNEWVADVHMNTEYQSQRTKVEELQGLSALEGMRRAFQLVMQSTGEHLAEKMAFHQRWYELVEQYTTRNLTRQTDRLMAIAGVADFVQCYTLNGRKFLAGLWSDIMVFNLLWTRAESSPAADRPSREMPTWSWGSIDGAITHRLKESDPAAESSVPTAPALNIEHSFQTKWEDITPLIEHEAITTAPLLIYNGLVHHATLKICCVLLTMEEAPVNSSLDIKVAQTAESLLVMPVVSFKNVHVAPLNSSTQVHGLILQKVLGKADTHRRVGYFWSVEEEVVEVLTAGKRALCPITLV